MKIFLAGTFGDKDLILKYPPRFLLESFYYFKDWQLSLLPRLSDFLLDSGAFTFMSGTVRSIDWDGYIKRYADFIVRNDIKKFFELDIDSVVGYAKVKEFRRELENLTNRPCIPVWHVSRGIDEFKRMCDEYSYVAIGGIVNEEIKRDKYYLLPALIKEAHKRKAKIHGLGFTSTSYWNKVHFDSVDSTTWKIGSRMGNLCFFNGDGMRQYCPSREGKAPKNTKQLDEINYLAWLKFQEYALTHF